MGSFPETYNDLVFQSVILLVPDNADFHAKNLKDFENTMQRVTWTNHHQENT